MNNTIKHIVTPEQMKACDALVEQHETGKQRLKDKIAAAESQVAPDGSSDVTSPAAQFGRAMRREDVVRRLQKLNPNLIYEHSKNWPLFGGLYIDDKSIDPLTMKPVGKRHLCGIPHEIVAEFDVRLVLKDRVPDPSIPLNWIEVPQIDGHIPGWRSTILKLVKGGQINLAAAEKEFEITKGRSSERWQQAVN